MTLTILPLLKLTDLIGTDANISGKCLEMWGYLTKHTQMINIMYEPVFSSSCVRSVYHCINDIIQTDNSMYLLCLSEQTDGLDLWHLLAAKTPPVKHCTSFNSVPGSWLNLFCVFECMFDLQLIINKDRAWVLKACLSFQRAQTRGLLSNHTVAD